MPKGARLWRLWRGPYRVDAQTKACQPCTPIPRTGFRATVRVDARGTHADASRRERLRRTREAARKRHIPARPRGSPRVNSRADTGRPHAS